MITPFTCSPLVGNMAHASNRVSVKIVFGPLAINQDVALTTLMTPSGTTLTHVSPAKSAGAEGGKKTFWSKAVNFYAAKLDAAPEHYAKLPENERKLFLRTLLLGHVGVAFPQKDGVFIRRMISKKTVVKQKKGSRVESYDGQRFHEVDIPINETQVTDSELYRGTGAYLLQQGVCDNTLALQEYVAEFEDPLLKRASDAIKTNPNDMRQAYAQIYAYLDHIRKKATDKQHRWLDYLQSACDSAMMHIYQYYMGAVLKADVIRAKLDDASCQYNRTIHATQDKFGGMVLALHPVFWLCMSSAEFLKTQIELAQHPSDGDLLNSMNVVFTRALSLYDQLCELEKKSSIDRQNAPKKTKKRGETEDHVDWDDEDEGDAVEPSKDSDEADSPASSVKRDGLTPLVIGAGARKDKPAEPVEDTKPANIVAAIQASKEEKTRVTACDVASKIALAHTGDKDVDVLLRTELHEQSVAECAELFGCSQGQISKMKKRGMKKAREYLAKYGISSYKKYGLLPPS